MALISWPVVLTGGGDGKIDKTAEQRNTEHLTNTTL